MRYVYLHGFASAPSSSKAQFFKRQFAAQNLTLEVPALVRIEDFEVQTITRQLGVVKELVGDAPAVLIGSSMGGYLAALHAASTPSVTKLVLMAPAFQFVRLWEQELGPESFAAWRESGKLAVHHYGEDRPIDVGFELIHDAASHAPEPAFSQPALIFQGTMDTVVRPAIAESFSRGRTNVDLRMLESDHQLTDQVELMWSETQRFLFD